ncbi:MAG: RNA polymerase sigma factor [Blastocatellia bacterium]
MRQAAAGNDGRTQNMTQPDDETLLRQMREGDGDAFEALYDRRQGPVYRFALRMSGSPAIAEDVTQDVFMTLIRDPLQFDPARGALSSYLYGMARHRVLKRLTRDRSFVSINSGDHGGDDHGALTDAPERWGDQWTAEDSPLLDLARMETVEMVRQAVQALPPHYREVVVLCNLEELSYEQAAEVLDCPVGTIRSRLNRARAALLDRLQVLRPDSVTSGGYRAVGDRV